MSEADQRDECADGEGNAADEAPKTVASIQAAEATRAVEAARAAERSASEAAQKAPGVDFAYFLWLASVATAVLASVCIMMALFVYVANFLSDLVLNAQLFGSVNYPGIAKVVGIFGLMSGVTHLLRLRMLAVANSAQPIPFPDEICASPNTGDPTIDKFECVGNVVINVYDAEVADAILAKREFIQKALEAALVIAISDPVVRYSKEKIEHTLRMGLGKLLPLHSIASVNIAALRHRVRSMEPPL